MMTRWHGLYARILDEGDTGFFIGLLRWVLRLVSVGFGIVVRWRRWMYRKGWLRSVRLPCCVVSVGNLTVGGTGKTPTTVLLARTLQERGARVAIISRGYGRRVNNPITLVSDGQKIIAPVAEAGDEPLLMAQQLPQAIVAVGADRAAVGRYVIDNFQPDVILLDDGFSHLRLQRDFDLVLLDGRQPFGNGYLLPAGSLREPVDHHRMADLLGLTHVDTPANTAHFEPPTVCLSYKIEGFRQLHSNETHLVNALQRIVAVSGIAHPKSFEETLRDARLDVIKHYIFADHHPYRREDIETILQETDLPIVLTEKDAVKWEALLPPEKSRRVWALQVRMHVTHGQREWAAFIEKILWPGCSTTQRDASS